MRFLLVFALAFSLLACTDRPAAAPALPAPSSAQASPHVQRAAPEAPPPLPPSAAPAPLVEHTVVDDDDFFFELPGRWEQSRTPDGGYDFRHGTEEIVVAAFPLKDGVNAAKSAERLSSAQRETAVDHLHCTELGEARRAASAHVGAVRLAFTCPTPPSITSFAAVSGVGDRVLSYEHYWYTATAMTPEMDRTDAANLATLLPKRAPQACPAAILAGSEKQGECLDATIFGEAVVAACMRELESRHRFRDDALSGAFSKALSRPMVCYRRAGM